MGLCKCIISSAAVFAALTLLSQDIYQKNFSPEIKSEFDRFLCRMWQQKKITPANEASDPVMVRRLYIDLLGRVPLPSEAESYISDKNPEKQAQLVQKLLNTEEHAMFMTMRLGDELRIKSEFPINLWPNAAFLYSRAIYDALRTNMPFDRFASELILADGSNFRNGYVNFFRAVPQKNASEIAGAAAGFLSGKDLSQLPEEEQKEFTGTFSGIRFKSTREWKEEIVYSIQMPAADPRVPFIRKIIAGKEFPRAAVRRTWRWIFGSENVDPVIYDHLAEGFRKGNYDLRALLYKICTSVAYKVGSFSKADNAVMIRNAAVYPIRRLDAEVLADSIAVITGRPYFYVSVIPEPFSYFNNRAAALTDGSVTDQFLLLFGRPSRDTGRVEERKRAITTDQRLYLFNSTDLNNRLNAIHRGPLKKEKDKFAALYMLFYSRKPTAGERQIFLQMVKKYKYWPVFSRMPWVLLNSREFLYQH